MKNYFSRLILFVVIGVVFSAFESPLRAASVDTTWAHLAFERAKLCEETANWDSAIVYLKGAQYIFEQGNEWGRWVDAVNEWANAMSEVGKFEETEELLNRALKKSIECWGESDVRVGDCYSVIATSFYLKKGLVDTAELFLQKSLKIFENSDQKGMSKVGMVYQEIASIYHDKNDPISAFRYNEIAEKKLINAKDALPDYFKDVYNDLGVSLGQMGRNEEAIVFLKRSLSLRKGIAMPTNDLVIAAHFNLGTALIRTGQFLEAICYLDSALALCKMETEQDSSVLGLIYNNLGYSSQRLGNYQAAIKNYQESLRFKESDENRYASGFATTIYNIGVIHRILGNIKLCQYYCSQSLIYNNGMSSANISLRSKSLSELAMVSFEIRDTTEAINYFEKSREERIKIYSENSIEMGIFYCNYGFACQRFGYIEKAIPLLMKAEKNLSDKKNGYMVDYANCIESLGSAYFQKGLIELSLRYFKKSLRIRSNAPPKMESNIWSSYSWIAAYYLAKKDLARAIYFTNLGINAIDMSKMVQNSLVAAKSGFTLLAFYIQKIRILEALGKSNVASSFSCILQATQLIEVLRTANSEDLKSNLGRSTNPIYEFGIDWALQLHDILPDSEYLQHAWRFSESSKSILLQESLQEDKARRFAGIPDSLLEKERETNILLSYNEQKLVEAEATMEPDPAKVSMFQDRVFDYRQEKDSLVARLQKEFPKYYKLKYDLQTVTVPEVQKWLLNDSILLLEYFYGDSNIYCFAVSKDTFSIHSFPNDLFFQSSLKTLQSHFADAAMVQNGMTSDAVAFQEFSNASYGLYCMLVSPALECLKIKPSQLVIVPDGPLGQIPFDVLLTKPAPKTEGVVYEKCHYLLEDYAIAYGWSATILLEGVERASIQADEIQLLAVAPPYELWPNDPTLTRPPKDGLDSLDLEFATRSFRQKGGTPNPLKYAALEAKELETRFGARVLIDSNATEAKFLSEAPQARIIHMGAHGFMNLENPEYSNIALLPSRRDTMQLDGRLHVSEIYNMELHADLVVLPVCNSSAGIHQTGEGIMSMARAFRYAGCPNVVASQWEVDDESAMEVSLSFYENLSQGMGKAEALRQAKLKRLREGGTAKAHPFYWAPMVLIGDNAPVLLNKVSNNRMWFLVIPALLLLVFGIGIRLRARRPRF